MKKVWETFIFALTIACLFQFRTRQDLVFGAIDESQYISLFENGRDFILGVDEKNIFTGTYTISKDTVLLIYQDHVDRSVQKRKVTARKFHKPLPVKLYINEGTSMIHSMDRTTFSARIYADARHEINRNPFTP